MIHPILSHLEKGHENIILPPLAQPRRSSGNRVGYLPASADNVKGISWLGCPVLANLILLFQITSGMSGATFQATLGHDLRVGLGQLHELLDDLQGPLGRYCLVQIIACSPIRMEPLMAISLQSTRC